MNYMNYSLKNTRVLVLLSLFSAIIILMSYLPYVGYISYGTISITTLHVPVIIGGILLGPINGLILGAVWGLTGLIKAFMTPTLEGLLFMNPLISVVPRMIVGFTVGLLAVHLPKFIKNNTIRYSIIGLVGSLCNTFLVIYAIAFFGDNAILPVEALQAILGIILGLNGSLEIFLAIAVVPTIVTVLQKVNPGGILHNLR